MSAPYRSSIKTAAYEFARSMSIVMADRRFEHQCDQLLETAKKELTGSWNGQFLRTGKNGAQESGSSSGDACSALQLAGQWMSDEVDGPDILSADTLKSIIANLTVLNDRASPFGPVSLVDSQGKPVAGAEILDAESLTYQAALYAGRGYPQAAIDIIRKLSTAAELNGEAWSGSAARALDGGTAVSHGSAFGACSVWNVLRAFEGFRIDRSQRRLYFTPHLSPDVHLLTAPVFAPGFMGTLEYRPGPRRSYLSFTLDRVVPTGSKPSGLQQGPGLEIGQLVLPPLPDKTDVFAGIGKAVVPGKTSVDSRGRTVYTFEAPIKMGAGERLDINIR
jgi:hypothetical protein